MKGFYVYDIETYPNVFTCVIVCAVTLNVWRFEISFRKNEGVELFKFLVFLRDSGARMVGFNNIGFDYPCIHELVKRSGVVTCDDIYQKAQGIINAKEHERFSHLVWESDHMVPQVDLYKIHHFDNVARSTSLKMLEFNMRSDSIEDLPFPPGTFLVENQVDTLIKYNDSDVFRTLDFLKHTIEQIEFRDEMTSRLGKNFTNHNDTKLGKDYFILELEKNGIPCFDRSTGRKQPIQTVRPFIDLSTVIFDYVKFEDEGFVRIKEWLSSQKITQTKGVFKDLSCTVQGFTYDFGVGGIHGSVESCTVWSDEDYAIIDVDVASYYPNLAIANSLYPAHLGVEFCEIYLDQYNSRKSYAKGTTENAMLKLALNGVYGDSNNKYSPFYDPAYTMSITINGQLLLCMLAESLIKIQSLEMIQINTDGLTVKILRKDIPLLNAKAANWEKLTKLELDHVEYSRMFIRDVNNYIAEYTSEEGCDAKLKRKGAYCYGDDLGWEKNHGFQVVARAAEAALVHDVSVEDFIYNHRDKYDFFGRTKIPRSSRLELRTPDGKVQDLQRITRYYVSKNGGHLVKLMPPLAKKLELDPESPWRKISIESGYKVEQCNNIHDYGSGAINYAYYIDAAKKLVNPLLNYR